MLRLSDASSDLIPHFENMFPITELVSLSQKTKSILWHPDALQAFTYVKNAIADSPFIS